jgi:hypothetical protein
MLISEKQHQANLLNAQHSTGPKTPEGKQAVRFNALAWSLRAQTVILPNEDPMDFQQIWEELDAQWQPQDSTERILLEQMAEAQWFLVRAGKNEYVIYETALEIHQRFALLDRVAVQRARLERSFLTSLHALKQQQKERRQSPAEPAKPAQTVPPEQPVEAPIPMPDEPRVPPPPYVMSPAVEIHPLSCAAAATDTR